MTSDVPAKLFDIAHAGQAACPVSAASPARIVVATHARFAEGICGSLEMICGKQPNVEFVSAYLDEGVDYGALFRDLVSSHDYAARPLVVVTDLMGGSVNNDFMQLRAEYPFLLVTGLNLPLLMELATYHGTLDETAVRSMAEESRSFVTFCGDELLSVGEDTDF